MGITKLSLGAPAHPAHRLAEPDVRARSPSRSEAVDRTRRGKPTLARDGTDEGGVRTRDVHLGRRGPGTRESRGTLARRRPGRDTPFDQSGPGTRESRGTLARRRPGRDTPFDQSGRGTRESRGTPARRRPGRDAPFDRTEAVSRSPLEPRPRGSGASLGTRPPTHPPIPESPRPPLPSRDPRTCFSGLCLRAYAWEAVSRSPLEPRPRGSGASLGTRPPTHPPIPESPRPPLPSRDPRTWFSGLCLRAYAWEAVSRSPLEPRPRGSGASLGTRPPTHPPIPESPRPSAPLSGPPYVLFGPTRVRPGGRVSEPSRATAAGLGGVARDAPPYAPSDSRVPSTSAPLSGPPYVLFGRVSEASRATVAGLRGVARDAPPYAPSDSRVPATSPSAGPDRRRRASGARISAAPRPTAAGPGGSARALTPPAPSDSRVPATSPSAGTDPRRRASGARISAAPRATAAGLGIVARDAPPYAPSDSGGPTTSPSAGPDPRRRASGARISAAPRPPAAGLGGSARARAPHVPSDFVSQREPSGRTSRIGPGLGVGAPPGLKRALSGAPPPEWAGTGTGGTVSTRMICEEVHQITSSFPCRVLDGCSVAGPEGDLGRVEQFGRVVSEQYNQSVIEEGPSLPSWGPGPDEGTFTGCRGEVLETRDRRGRPHTPAPWPHADYGADRTASRAEIAGGPRGPSGRSAPARRAPPPGPGTIGRGPPETRAGAPGDPAGGPPCPTGAPRALRGPSWEGIAKV
ncbi:collagen alpha-1(I) chain-like [Trichomycterus rosablanca]|uniref:collagen alpha-1(I) chain-like n=1 Tax=Trichomycterus rosablanca TaxID=2290929 RepID=UPI002F35C023